MTSLPLFTTSGDVCMVLSNGLCEMNMMPLGSVVCCGNVADIVVDIVVVADIIISNDRTYVGLVSTKHDAALSV